ncbi:MAG: cob(I)yrinic acid a,c-diamide adenosyltransferase [Clostridium sp.]|nr:cob(I)yrinic acid a,c-diamide adenosyltransferase [Clostridium sp.]
MIHLYCGDGKGKSTAAAGLAVRMAGSGGKAVFARFLKSDGLMRFRVFSRMACSSAKDFIG